MQVGNKVKIVNTDSFFDGKEGILEFFDKDKNIATVFVDFNLEENKRIRQDFNLDNIELLEESLKEDVDLINDECHYQDHIKEELAKYFNVDIDNINALDENTYEIEDDTEYRVYYVATHQEAFDEAVRQVKYIIEDLGLEAFTPDYVKYIKHYFLNTDKIKEYMKESYEYYVDDIEEESDDEFSTRLIRELYESNILSDDDFESEDDEVNYLKLKDSVDLDSKKDEFVTYLVNSEESVSWLENMYSSSDLEKFIIDNNLLDIQAVAEDCVNTDGIAHQLSSYDGKELEIRDDLFAYRIN